MPNRSNTAEAPYRYAPVARYQRNPTEAKRLLGLIKRYGGLNQVNSATADDVPPWVENHDQLVRWLGFMAMDGVGWTRWSDFWEGPRQIFDLSGPLIADFEETDVDKVPITALREPYPDCYLHFGPNSTALLTHELNPFTREIGTFCVDGVYVRVYRDHVPESDEFTAMHLDFATRWVGREVNSRSPRGVFEPHFSARISGTTTAPIRASADDPRYGDPLLPLATVGEGIIDGMAYDEYDASFYDERLREHVETLMPKLPRLAKAVGPISVYADHVRAIRPVLGNAIRLTINALFYVCNYPAQQKRMVDPSAPPEVASVLSDPKLKSARKTSAERVLKERGFGYVTMCSPVSSEAAPSRAVGSERSSVSTHWRRGHWRHQRVGVGRGGIRLTWIRPALVAAESGQIADGRAYSVVPSPPSPPEVREQ